MIPPNLLSSSLSFSPPPTINPSPLRRSPDPLSRPNFSSRLPPVRRARSLRGHCRRGGPSRGWNAEPVRPGRAGHEDGDEEGGGKEEEDPWRSSKRRWWFDDDDLDDEFDPFDDDDSTEQPWDRIWIFKVFKAYGYLLPAIIASLLLATGPKAFLMALALPLGQSALSLALDKLWGKASEEPRTKPKRQKKPFFGDFKRQRQDVYNGDYKGQPSYQSWVSTDPSVAQKGGGSQRPTFGGWDELDRQGRPPKGSVRRPPETQAGPVKRGKLSKRGRYRDVPLLLRLLIAVFPFLGSWTRIL